MAKKATADSIDLGSELFRDIELEALRIARKALVTKDDVLGTALRDGATYWYEGINIALDLTGTPIVVR